MKTFRSEQFFGYLVNPLYIKPTLYQCRELDSHDACGKELVSLGFSRNVFCYKFHRQQLGKLHGMFKIFFCSFYHINCEDIACPNFSNVSRRFKTLDNELVAAILDYLQANLKGALVCYILIYIYCMYIA